MQVQLDDQNRVVAYADIGGVEGGIQMDDDTVPEEFQVDFWAGKWRLKDGNLELTGEAKPAEPTEDTPDSIPVRLAELEAQMAEMAAAFERGLT